MTAETPAEIYEREQLRELYFEFIEQRAKFLREANPKNPQPVIFDCGIQDDWLRHSLASKLLVIPTDSSRIVVNSSNLDLIADFKNGKPKILPIYAAPEKPIFIDSPEVWAYVPLIALTGDDRIFIRTDLLRDNYNGQRFSHFLKSLSTPEINIVHPVIATSLSETLEEKYPQIKLESGRVFLGKN